MIYVIWLLLLLPLAVHAQPSALTRRLRPFYLPCHDLLHPDQGPELSAPTSRWIKERLEPNVRDAAEWRVHVEYVKGASLRARVLRAVDQATLFDRLGSSTACPTTVTELPRRDWQARITRGHTRVVVDALHFDAGRDCLRSGEVLIDLPAARVDLERLTREIPMHAWRIARAGGERVLLALDLDARLEVRLAKTLRLADRLTEE